jgi:hypothetical protein
MIIWLRRPRNWRGETTRQELERRVKALEASVQSAHDRINEVDERLGELRLSYHSLFRHYKPWSPLEINYKKDES